MKWPTSVKFLFFIWVGATLFLPGCSSDISLPLSPEEELRSFQLAPGLKIELVAAEPLVQEPVVIQFDRKGRLWVVEMRSFMQDIDGTDETAPIGRVSVLLDDNGDGKMDRSIVFADSLVLPRSIAFVEDGVLVAEDEPLWLYQDLDGDLKADQRFLIDSAYAKKGIVEHAPNGLLTGHDGWLYSAKSDHRYKKIDGDWVKEKTEFRGQWGISKDDVGRLYYNYNWSQLHADLVPPNYLNRNPHHHPTTGIDVGLTVNRSVFPIRPNLAANRGYLPETLDAEGKIKEFTSACSPFVYRGDLLPNEYLGNVFVCEPVGNLIKRNLVVETSYNLHAEYAYDSTEFVASTDERFRPVALTSGPDGALYIADMYHGIIEHGIYMTEYLREVTQERKLTGPVHCGRIWRIVPEKHRQIPYIDLESLNTSDLISVLDHRNGWYRDQAQQLIIERNDHQTIELLNHKARDQSTNYTARIHALWTLFEMGVNSAAIYLDALEDKNSHVQALAIRLLESLVGTGAIQSGEFSQKMFELAVENDPIVHLQISLSASVLEARQRQEVLRLLINKHNDEPLIRDAVLSSLTNSEYDFLLTLMDQKDWNAADPGKSIMIEMLASAITKKANARELTWLVGYLDQSDGAISWKQKAILEGMSLSAMEENPTAIQLPKQPGLFSGVNAYEETYRDKIQMLTGLFDWPGKPVSRIENDSLTIKVDPEQYAYGRKQYLNICAGCHGNDGKGLNRFGPPLRNSEWVLGSEKRLALLLIHGMQGPVIVAGKEYDAPDILPEMPSFSVFDDGKIAAIMTYIRNEWGHKADPVSGRTVAGYRVRAQGKMTPWTAEELMEVSD
tara:strand:- start:104950 stop:107472 length:2523 start_codon:yes stop_codon:yes gene_type:complete